MIRCLPTEPLVAALSVKQYTNQAYSEVFSPVKLYSNHVSTKNNFKSYSGCFESTSFCNAYLTQDVLMCM